ncbi:MAG: polynucleotide adenylyltransferase PcnB [bacterium]|nr:polynucleotide adenylyltransferase PcnB [bacterium]
MNEHNDEIAVEEITADLPKIIETVKEDTAIGEVQVADLTNVIVAEVEMPAVVVEPEIANEKIDLNALWVVRRLRAKGYEAYLTGGCVRDLLLNKTPKDFDVATNARPEEVKRIFRNCRLIGRRFLLAHIFFPTGKIIETATFRANPIDLPEDIPSEDLLVTRDNVYGDIEEDAKRRDLTINGLFYDPVAGKVIDYVGGRADLDANLIRTIGDPEIRFREDPIRILRAIKFASRLGFEIEKDTLQAMQRHVGEIPRSAPARIQEEMVRLLTSSEARKAFLMCRDLGVLEVLMPEVTESLQMELLPKADAEGLETKILSVEERNDYWLALLNALDEVVNKNADVSSAVAFSLLLLPGYIALEQSAQNERNWIDKLCVSWSDKIRLTRHDQDRIRLLLSTINLFRDEKYAEPSALHLVRKPWFREALLIYIFHLTARGESLEKIGMWKAIAKSLDKPYQQDLRGQRAMLPKFGRGFSRGRPQRRRNTFA